MNSEDIISEVNKIVKLNAYESDDYIHGDSDLPFTYNESRDEQMLLHEQEQINIAEEIAAKYKQKFVEYGLTLRYDVSWANSPEQVGVSQRLPFARGYVAIFSIVLLDGDKVVETDIDKNIESEIAWCFPKLVEQFGFTSISFGVFKWFWVKLSDLEYDLDSVLNDWNKMIEIGNYF